MSYNTYLREQIDWNVTQDAIGYFDASDNYVFKRSYNQWIQAYRPQKFWGIDLKTMELVEPPVGDKDNDGSNVKPKGTPPKKATESIHNILDAAGFIPGIGTPAGLIDAGIYTFIDGDYTSGFITAATSIPGLKQAKGVASIVKSILYPRMWTHRKKGWGKTLAKRCSEENDSRQGESFFMDRSRGRKLPLRLTEKPISMDSPKKTESLEYRQGKKVWNPCNRTLV